MSEMTTIKVEKSVVDWLNSLKGHFEWRSGKKYTLNQALIVILAEYDTTCAIHEKHLDRGSSTKKKEEYMKRRLEQFWEKDEIPEWNHASAILENDFQNEWNDIIEVLTKFRLYKSHIIIGGGGRSKVSQSLDKPFYHKGWKEHDFETKITVDNIVSETPTHKVDCVKNKVALEIEWSNKDPFFDRDLNNFRLLFERDAIDVGVIITKSDELRETFETLGIWSKYGTSTTWMNKLIPRIDGGGGGGCPILVFGITKILYVEDSIDD